VKLRQSLRNLLVVTLTWGRASAHSQTASSAVFLDKAYGALVFPGGRVSLVTGFQSKLHMRNESSENKFEELEAQLTVIADGHSFHCGIVCSGRH